MNNKPKLFKDVCKLFMKAVNDKFKPWQLENPASMLDIYKYGLMTIFHIFSFNVENAEFSIIKTLEETIIFYIEYVSQSQEEKNSFLKLTPQDASMFLLKKHLIYIGSKCVVLDELLDIYVKFNDTINRLELSQKPDEKWWEEDLVDRIISC